MKILLAVSLHLAIAFVVLHRAPAPPSSTQTNTPPAPGFLTARVVSISEEGTNCGGAQISLAVIVDGRIRLLQAGGHCYRTHLHVGDTVLVAARFRGTTDHPWAPDVDGTADIVEDADMRCESQGAWTCDRAAPLHFAFQPRP